MTIETVNNLQTPIGEILQRAATDGIVLHTQGKSPFAVVPLDDDLLDFLVERNPRFAEDCRKIRERMLSGAVHSQEEINALFGRSGA